jgi:hypothetical protein
MQSWLYDISERINSLVSVLDEADDKSIEPDVKNAIQGIYESDVPAAVADGIEYIKKQTAFLEAIDKRMEELKALKQSRKNRLERVRRGYCEFLVAVGKKKIETPCGNMTVSAPTVSTVIDSIDDLPDAYKRTTVKIEPDKASIKQAIQGGHSVPGAHLEEKQSIRIK